MIEGNPYRPHLLRIADMRDETPDVRTLGLTFVEPDTVPAVPAWTPGQFGEFSVFGEGESVFAISNAPPSTGTRPSELRIECTFRAVGKVTHALRRLSQGDTIGFRGPYGNGFPIDSWRGRDLIFVGGGIGMAALRSPLLEALRRRPEFGSIIVLNGARTVADLVYAKEMKEWERIDDVRVVRTVDPGGEGPGWKGQVGVIPEVFKGLGLKPDGRIVVACGPPVMLHFLFIALEALGYSPDQVVTTLENKMKCGIGLCGRCNVGPFYVCTDGPVVTWAQLNRLPKDL
jgi:sulfhydrogenase subunit gamma (sulfur reductase)